MDNTIEGDLLVQRAAVELLADLRRQLPCLLRSRSDQERYPKEGFRERVSTRRLYDILRLLDSFQESPQLLDSSLKELLDPLSAALIASIPLVVTPKKAPAKATALPAAVCKLLYGFCKVRGPKVVIRFFSNEARNIVAVLQTLEAGESHALQDAGSFVWEERFIFLLWLSHLVLTPFPLSSAGRLEIADSIFPAVDWTLPATAKGGLVESLCNVGHYYSRASGKERVAAIAMLVRLVLRPDVQEMGILHSSLAWAQHELRKAIENDQEDVGQIDSYHVLGVMSFVSGIFSQADALTLASFVSPLFAEIRSVSTSISEASSSSRLSAVGKKTAIKIYRSAALTALYLVNNNVNVNEINVDEILEDTIGQLMEWLADQDAPVRLAASKSLAVITTKLQQDMAIEVIEAINTGFEENVIWPNDTTEIGHGKAYGDWRRCDLNLVSASRWQGLTLTLSHLLFRKAPPEQTLAGVLDSLLLALSFEQRSTTGASVGNTVRDAANYGIWSLARGYTTNELMSVGSTSLGFANGGGQKTSILQLLAGRLVCTACCDPDGNVRRGSSAALQEMIGRHPDTIVQGINIVQTVDYHAVSLLAKAMNTVALAASQISALYREELVIELLGWRGIWAADAATRRHAAEALGNIVRTAGASSVFETLASVWSALFSFVPPEVGNRHGSLLAIARLLSAVYELPDEKINEWKVQISERLETLWAWCAGSEDISESSFTNFSLRPALTAESFCSAIAQGLRICSRLPRARPDEKVISTLTSYIGLSLNLKEALAYEKAAQAAFSLLTSGVLLPDSREQLVQIWLQRAAAIIDAGPGRQSHAPGWLCVLSTIYPIVSGTAQEKSRKILINAMKPQSEIETRVAALTSLRLIVSDAASDSGIIDAICSCLQDYTTDQRGDVGSLARIGALECANALPKEWHTSSVAASEAITTLVCGLAAEKLDKVRSTGLQCLVTALAAHDRGNISDSVGRAKSFKIYRDNADVSSIAYFRQILNLSDVPALRKSLLLGICLSISGGSEAVADSCRTALAEYLLDADDMTRCTILQSLTGLLSTRIGDERTIMPIMETIAFALETETFRSVYRSPVVIPSFKSIFLETQKAHLKSTVVAKLLAAIHVYTSLAVVDCVRTSAIRKLVSMLLHPFPRVRQEAAESLYCITSDDSLLPVNWTETVKKLKPAVGKVRLAILPS